MSEYTKQRANNREIQIACEERYSRSIYMNIRHNDQPQESRAKQ